MSTRGRTLRIHINDCGDGKETVVMLHGSGPGPPAGPTSAAILTRWSRRAIALLLDCPGWGKSDAIVNSGSRSDLNARILKSVVDQLGIDKVHLLGNSMGGHSAVAFTLSWPERVAKLVLMGGDRRHEPVHADADRGHQAAERPVPRADH
ncbi:alpha/beta fold hydrolase [Klebsiella pneumoniae subsp. pneumoniae]|nr:alpha/beta fold hydrolase [Klebsiella pneumoniae subsp. pneumoniae]